jgi:hypothetical protein
MHMPANSTEPTLDIAIVPIAQPLPIPEPDELHAPTVQFTTIKELTLDVGSSPIASPLPIPEPYELLASIVQFTMIKEVTFDVALPLPA